MKVIPTFLTILALACGKHELEPIRKDNSSSREKVTTISPQTQQAKTITSEEEKEEQYFYSNNIDGSGLLYIVGKRDCALEASVGPYPTSSIIGWNLMGEQTDLKRELYQVVKEDTPLENIVPLVIFLRDYDCNNTIDQMMAIYDDNQLKKTRNYEKINQLIRTARLSGDQHYHRFESAVDERCALTFNQGYAIDLGCSDQVDAIVYTLQGIEINTSPLIKVLYPLLAQGRSLVAPKYKCELEDGSLFEVFDFDCLRNKCPDGFQYTGPRPTITR